METSTRPRNIIATRPKARFLLPPSHGPPAPTNVDIEIARNNGTSVATEAINGNLQASKSKPTLSLSRAVEQRTPENGRLRQENCVLT